MEEVRNLFLSATCLLQMASTGCALPPVQFQICILQCRLGCLKEPLCRDGKSVNVTPLHFGPIPPPTSAAIFSDEKGVFGIQLNVLLVQCVLDLVPTVVVLHAFVFLKTVRNLLLGLRF
uniref:Uncharacterized protein n=1 Tax=Sphaerodactylus townsendi TaxID=933632 RepID=A0ACB8FY74_9SAUR